MLELDIARSRIRRRPDGACERTLFQVIAALESGSPVDLGALYDLDCDNFNLAIGILRGWWLQRYTGVARNGVIQGHTYIEKRHSGH